MPLRDIHDPVHLAGNSAVMNDHNSLCFRSYQLLNLCRINVGNIGKCIGKWLGKCNNNTNSKWFCKCFNNGDKYIDRYTYTESNTDSITYILYNAYTYPKSNTHSITYIIHYTILFNDTYWVTLYECCNYL